MSQKVLALNCGSSSIKFCLYESVDKELIKLLDGVIEDIGERARWHCQISGLELSQPIKTVDEQVDYNGALTFIFSWILNNISFEQDMLIGHRVVHGGVHYSAPVLITKEILDKLKEFTPLAPLHQPHNLHAIEMLASEYPHLKQIACFDTAFHIHHEKPINQYAIPNEYYEKGIRRYGFHGLSYEYITKKIEQQKSPLNNKKYIIAHLGNGASLCAIKNGISIDTTMGFSALDGLMMGTRCGDIDPGVLLYLLDHEKLTKANVTDLLYKHSGLLGVSGLSYDMRDLYASDQPSAQEAIHLYVYRIVREIGALTAVLNGIDGLVFTGGIGENAGFIRERVINHLSWLGAEIDEKNNDDNATIISSNNSKLHIEVINTDEEKMLAEHTLSVITETSTTG